MAEVIESSLVIETTASMAKKMKLILYSEQKGFLEISFPLLYPFYEFFYKELHVYNFCKY